MHKILTALVFLAVSTTASAFDLGVSATRDYANANRTALGLTVSQKFGYVGVEGGFERFNQNNDQDRWSLLGTFDVAKISRATVTAKAGAAYLNNQTGADGYAWVAGVGASMPLTKRLAATVDYRLQRGQDRVQSFDGNTIGAGLKYTF